MRSRSPNPAPKTAPLSSRLAGMLRMAFFKIVIMKGNTFSVMTSTRPPKEKKDSEMRPVKGNNCWNSPRRCINRIQPMEAM